MSLYLRLLSLRLATLKQTKFEDKTVRSTQPSLALIGLHDFLIFSNRTAHAWSVEAGKHMFGLSLFRPSRQSNISTSGEERFKYPLPWENKISQVPYPRVNKDNLIPTPCPASLPHRLYIDRCITNKWRQRTHALALEWTRNFNIIANVARSVRRIS